MSLRVKVTAECFGVDSVVDLCFAGFQGANGELITTDAFHGKDRSTSSFLE